MSESFSQCVVLGALRRPVHVEALPTGARLGHFELLLRKQTATGTWFTVAVPCELWGKHLDTASRLRAGQACLFTGELARRKRGESYEMLVSGWQLEPLTLPAPVPDAAMSRN